MSAARDHLLAALLPERVTVSREALTTYMEEMDKSLKLLEAGAVRAKGLYDSYKREADAVIEQLKHERDRAETNLSEAVRKSIEILTRPDTLAIERCDAVLALLRGES